MFGKRPSELTRDDIERLIADEVQEGTDIELKETLPAREGCDPWLNGGNRIGDRARNEIIAKVIAFANAYGGTLVIGVSETDDSPARAASIVPLPRCADLAERLRLQCRDCIEPQVPLLEVAGVPTNEDGSGVVVFRVPRSRMAPHRHTVTKECYVRRSDRSERMTMREIQDLTLQVERGLGAIDAKFQARREKFVDELPAFFGDSERAFGLRATMVPLTPLYIERVHNNDAVRPPLNTLSGMIGNAGPYELFVPIRRVDWRPILRGTRAMGGDDRFALHREVCCDGLVEYVLLVRQEEGRERLLLYITWVMGLVGNALCAAEKFRRAADAPDVEYGLEFEVGVVGSDLQVGIYGRDHFGLTLGPFPQGQTVFPRYSVGRPEEFATTTALIERDFWNAASFDTQDRWIEVDYAAAFKEMGLAPTD